MSAKSLRRMTRHWWSESQESKEPKVPRIKITAIGNPSNQPLSESLRANGIIDPQVQCPFFSGAISQEIVNLVFEYAMTESYAESADWRRWRPSVDAEESLSESWKWVRPDYQGRKIIYTSLLRTCKRIYLDLNHLVPLMRTHIFWHPAITAPPNLGFADRSAEAIYFSRFTKEQLEGVEKVRICMKQSILESSEGSTNDEVRQNLNWICSLPEMRDVRRLWLTIRASDWSGYKNNAPLTLSPQSGFLSVSEMKQQWAQFKGEIRSSTGEYMPVEWNSNAWGCTPRKIRHLRELLLEFEVQEWQRGELEEIVDNAKHWRFPMGHRGSLIYGTNGEDVEVSTWRGPFCNWSVECPVCKRTSAKEVGQQSTCFVCEERTQLMERKLGPMLVVMKMRFRLCPPTTYRSDFPEAVEVEGDYGTGLMFEEDEDA